MAKAKELISIIIPMYNVEQYFPRCIESVINQTYKKLEIILVDDGSTDLSGTLADQYAEQDQRIKVVHQPNGGNAVARNTGLKQVTGNWILFVDSDDYVEPNYVELLYNTAIKYDADLSLCNLQVYEWNHPQKITGKNKATVKSTAEALSSLFYQKGTTPGPCAKLYRTKLFKNISFPVGKICEDLAITYQLFARAKKVVFNSQTLYYYLTNPSSTMQKQMRNFKRDRVVGLDFCEEAVTFVDEKFPELHTAATNRLFTEAIYIFTDLPRTKEYADVMDRVWKIIKDNRATVIADPESKANIRGYAKISYGGKRALLATLRTKNVVGNYLGAKRRKKTTTTLE